MGCNPPLWDPAPPSTLSGSSDTEGLSLLLRPLEWRAQPHSNSCFSPWLLLAHLSPLSVVVNSPGAFQNTQIISNCTPAPVSSRSRKPWSSSPLRLLFIAESSPHPALQPQGRTGWKSQHQAPEPWAEPGAVGTGGEHVKPMMRTANSDTWKGMKTR